MFVVFVDVFYNLNPFKPDGHFKKQIRNFFHKEKSRKLSNVFYLQNNPVMNKNNKIFNFD